MSVPESSFEHFEAVKVGEPMQTAIDLQTAIDSLTDSELKKEFSTPVLEFLNRSWDYRNMPVNVIGKIIGPDYDDPDTNIYHEFVCGQAIGFTLCELKLNQQTQSLITISIDKMLKIQPTKNPFASPGFRRLQFHAAVKDSPILELAS